MEIKSQKALCLPGGTDASCNLLWHNVIDTLLSKEEEKVRTEQKLLCCPQRRSFLEKNIIINTSCAKVHKVRATYKRQVCCVCCVVYFVPPSQLF